MQDLVRVVARLVLELHKRTHSTSNNNKAKRMATNSRKAVATRRRQYNLMDFLRTPAYAGQPVQEETIPCTSYILTTTATTGLIANTTGLNINSIVGFSTRYADLWSEYAIVGGTIEITPLQQGASGISAFFFDDFSTSVPTLNESMGRIVRKLSNSAANPKSTTVMNWTARSLQDLTFQPTTLGYTAVNFKVYTDNTNYGSPTTATQLWLIRPKLKIILRGLKSL